MVITTLGKKGSNYIRGGGFPIKEKKRNDTSPNRGKKSLGPVVTVLRETEGTS